MLICKFATNSASKFNFLFEPSKTLNSLMTIFIKVSEGALSSETSDIVSNLEQNHFSDWKSKLITIQNYNFDDEKFVRCGLVEKIIRILRNARPKNVFWNFLQKIIKFVNIYSKMISSSST